MKIPDGAIVLSCGMPASFTMVFQNPKARYVYGFTDCGFSFEYSEKSREMIRKLLEENKDNIYAIWSPDGQFQHPEGYIERPEIMEPDYFVDYNSCKVVVNNHKQTIGFCKIYQKR